ncbi:hypothetical protein Sfulv_15780 [Streptomyces fulvorobeus]|uniref:Uncharacterized protein n=1 Tax=Streptomyces fulvorobeus TaxID=284028 RepID=A0A7J0C3V5_9ACTN|nr:hypothetical protein Sfulv_15780 [Streptomyces fulvorobeus]
MLERPVGAGEPVSPGLAALLGTSSAPHSPAAAKDREHLALLGTTAMGSEGFAALQALADDPAVLALYERLDALASAPADDPRIAPLAADLVAAVPGAVLEAIPDSGPVVTGFGEALLADYPPAQAEVVRLVMTGMTGVTGGVNRRRR